MTANDVSDKGDMDKRICLTNIPVKTTEFMDQEQSDNPLTKKSKVSSPFLEPLGSNMTNLTPCAMVCLSSSCHNILHDSLILLF